MNNQTKELLGVLFIALLALTVITCTTESNQTRTVTVTNTVIIYTNAPVRVIIEREPVQWDPQPIPMPMPWLLTNYGKAQIIYN